MRTLYLDCGMGVSADAMLAALYELLENQSEFHEKMERLQPMNGMVARNDTAWGIPGTKIGMNGEKAGVSGELPKITQDVQEIFCRLDAVADRDTVFRHGEEPAHIIGVALAIQMLRPEQVHVSVVRFGEGDSTMPVPAPATLKLLKGIPCCAGTVRGELCTPVGAALLTYYGQEFGPMPVMRIEKTGCGISEGNGLKRCVRAFWGSTDDHPQLSIVELCCNVDDMSAEALAFAGERLLEQGALDVSSMPLTMKKGRLGVRLAVLCHPRDEQRMAEAIMRETTTNGVRALYCGKYLLKPSGRTVETVYGPMRVKCADGYGIHHEKPEYDDVAAAARAQGVPIRMVWEEVLLEARKTAEKR